MKKYGWLICVYLLLAGCSAMFPETELRDSEVSTDSQTDSNGADYSATVNETDTTKENDSATETDTDSASIDSETESGTDIDTDSASVDSETESDTDIDSDTVTNTDSDTATDSGVDTESDTGFIGCDPGCPDGLECNANWGICVEMDCTGQPDLTPCNLVTVADRSYDVCVNGVCVSPGCGTTDCNVPAPYFPLPDTNQVSCFNDGAKVSDCPADDVAFYGQDAQYGWDLTGDINTRFDSTTVSAAPGEPIVEDTVAGLIWQGCRAGLSDNDCETGLAADTMQWAEAVTYCDELEWGGHSDWRLPDEFALQTILNYGVSSMAAFPAFPNTANSYYWASSTSSANATDAWVANFENGIVGYHSKTENSNAVMCVRGGAGTARQLTLNADAPTAVPAEPIVTDSANGLVWQGCSAGLDGNDCLGGTRGILSWSGALAYCANSTWRGESDWRLPNANELRSIIDDNAGSPAINSSMFPNVAAQRYWTSTTYSNGRSYAWAVNFATGILWNEGKNSTSYDYHAICVRDL